jgi:hypothetical protein
MLTEILFYTARQLVIQNIFYRILTATGETILKDGEGGGVQKYAV